VIARGITFATLWSGLALWAPLVFPHEAAFHVPAWLAGSVNYLSGVAYVLGAIAIGLLAGQCGRNAIAVSFAVLAMGLIGGAIASADGDGVCLVPGVEQGNPTTGVGEDCVHQSRLGAA
jgi:hypothetical protein